MKDKSKYIFLGVAISYFIIAYIQTKTDGILPIWIFYSVAFLSCELTVLELLKSLVQALLLGIDKQKYLELKQYYLLKKNIEILYKNGLLSEQIDTYEKLFIPNEPNEIEIRHDKRVYIFKRFNCIITAIQMIVSTVIMIITPLKVIPNDIDTEKSINIITLLTFAVMFLKYFFDGYEMDAFNEIDESSEKVQKLSSYYLSLIEEMSENQENNNRL